VNQGECGTITVLRHILREPAIHAGWDDVADHAGRGRVSPEPGPVRAGAHRALSCVDLIGCAVAAQRGLVIMHGDNGFATTATVSA
jgi:hypothetical protein